MSQVRLTDEEIQKLIECIQAGADVPEDLLPKLSPGFFERLRVAGKFDYKELDKYKIAILEYAGKRVEAVILAQAVITGGAAPLQVLRSFGESGDDEWRNMIVQGDNLQFLKTCYMNQDSLIKDKVKGKVKLVYIDPPFGTGDEYESSNGEMSYSAKIIGAEFIESLRERIIYLKELLSKDGSMFVRIDYHFGHYIKVIMDEIFNRANFKNEIVINRFKRQLRGLKQFNAATDILLFYSKDTNANFFKEIMRSRLCSFCGVEKAPEWIPMSSPGIRRPPERVILGRNLLPPRGRHWTFIQPTIDIMEKEGRIRINEQDTYTDLEGSKIQGVPEYLQTEDTPVDSNWTDLRGYVRSKRYPTENPEELLARAIFVASEKDDLIMDVFGGSGTTAAVAEKMGRRWITGDFGKNAIYVMQKRIFNIQDTMKIVDGNLKKTKYAHLPQPFDIISAGAYDFSKIMNLREHKDSYISFVLGLFGISRESNDFSKKYKLPNIYAEKEGDPVEVYPIWEDEYLKEIRIDEEYLKSIIDASGGKLKGDYYIITPENCTIVGNLTVKNSQKEDINFHMLKFPYKVLEDVSRQFHIEEQPSSSADINKLISSTGFYFNEEVSIKVKKENNGIKIEDFSTMILNSKKELFKGLDGLSMILVDNNYDGKVFTMDQTIYAKDISKDGLVKISGISKKRAIIAIDKHGNESPIMRI